MALRRPRPTLAETIRRADALATVAGLPATRGNPLGSAEELAQARAELAAVDQNLAADLRAANAAARKATALFDLNGKMPAPTWRSHLKELSTEQRAVVQRALTLAKHRQAVRDASTLLGVGHVAPLATLAGKVPTVAECPTVRVFIERWQAPRTGDRA